MYKFLQYPEHELAVPPVEQLNRYKSKSPGTDGPTLDPLFLDLASKGSSDWNNAAAKLFVSKFLSLDISDCKDKDLIEAAFLTNVDYLRTFYLKRDMDVARKAIYARDKARYARRKYVAPLSFFLGPVSQSTFL